MKKFLFALLILAPIGLFAKDRLSDIGPSLSTANVTATITISSNSQQNCLDFVHANATNTYRLSILDVSTTDYQLTMPAGEPLFANFDPPLCNSVKESSMTITAVADVSSTTVRVNYKGFVGR